MGESKYTFNEMKWALEVACKKAVTIPKFFISNLMEIEQTRDENVKKRDIDMAGSDGDHVVFFRSRNLSCEKKSTSAHAFTNRN